MNGPLKAENLDVGCTDEGTPTLLPKSLYFMQQEDYVIDSINEAHTVKTEGSDTAHIVFNVTTYDYRRNDPRLDAVEHQLDMWVCDCWDYRSGFPDLREDTRPSDYTGCKHIDDVSKVQRAKRDEDQRTL